MYKNIAKIYYQYPNQERYFHACGFFIGNYLLTAGHVVNSKCCTFWTEINDTFIKLDKRKFFSLCKENPYNVDLAIFELNINNPLIFSTENPQSDMELLGCCFMDDGVSITEYTLLTINNRNGLYFEGIASEQLYQGSSGSPLFYRGQVIGMIVGGNIMNDGNIKDPRYDAKQCRYLSSTAIIDIIKKL